jgi:SAM-dependent methyltransferase
VLDLDTGDGLLLRLLKIDRPNKDEAIMLDVSPTMLKAAQDRFANDYAVKVVEYDFNFPLPNSLGCFDAVVSALLYTTKLIWSLFAPVLYHKCITNSVEIRSISTKSNT